MIKEYIQYFKDNPQHLWFKAKLYGWGWTPVTWQGWVVILVYVALVLPIAYTIEDNTITSTIVLTRILPIAILTGILIGICYKTGEKPRWQWGPPRQK